MGTYLDLILKDRSEENINKTNEIWNTENTGYENTLHFITRVDIEKDIESIHNDPECAHLKYIKTVADWDKTFPIWSYGTFQVKITMGDYLCSEMARRYLEFINKHPDLFVESPEDNVINILKETINEDRVAEDCLVKCPKCVKSMVEPIHYPVGWIRSD